MQPGNPNGLMAGLAGPQVITVSSSSNLVIDEGK
jgi:hypothetical protein